jgi:hypothetical protein
MVSNIVRQITTLKKTPVKMPYLNALNVSIIFSLSGCSSALTKIMQRLMRKEDIPN